jgi:hypothetical protein
MIRPAYRLFLLLAAFPILAAPDGPSSNEPVRRAVVYLEREVPRWRREHPCYSCHNNGDAARALIAASQRGHRVEGALRDTLTWLSRPESWDDKPAGTTAGQTPPPGGALDDKPLARIQFAGGLTSAVEASLADATALARAAALVAADQKPDGSWRLDTSRSLGSPATYGTALATWSALRTLRASDDARFDTAIARGEGWIRVATAVTVLDAAAIVLALDVAEDDPAAAQRQRCLNTIKRGEAPNGGWGPYVTSAAEPFDTAVALLSLNVLARKPALASPALDATALRATIDRGRQFLIDTQAADGHWPETTRPANQESYAQRISTTAWVTLALLEGRER